MVQKEMNEINDLARHLPNTVTNKPNQFFVVIKSIDVLNNINK
jgi:hypothetical protein